MTIHRTERGDLVKVHRIALELVRRKPDDPNSHHVLGYVLRYGGSLDEAGRECEIAVLLATKVVWGSCSTTYCGLTEPALQMVQIAIYRHYCSYPAMDRDPFFNGLRRNP